MKFDKLLRDFTRGVIVLAILGAILAVADELTMLRSDIFDMKRMLTAHAAHMRRRLEREQARNADAPKHEAPSRKDTAHAEVPEPHESRNVG